MEYKEESVHNTQIPTQNTVVPVTSKVKRQYLVYNDDASQYTAS